tara:strand:- start:16095 stop:16967 length:873 start_codon:yes stop_codon:yes gene_type:complete
LINYSSSTFTWKSKSFKEDAYYKYPGGFVGSLGEKYHVRFNTQSSFIILDEKSKKYDEVFLGSPCRSEYTIAKDNLFQVPSNEFRMALTNKNKVNIASKPNDNASDINFSKLEGNYIDYKLDIREYNNHIELKKEHEVIKATLNGDLLNAKCSYKDELLGLTVTLEFPVNLINLNYDENEFQVCTGPIIVPDLSSWKIGKTGQVFLAHVAFSSFNYIELILRRNVKPENSEMEWITKPIGLNRNELINPDKTPPLHPEKRWEVTTYNEVWKIKSINVFLSSQNEYIKRKD